MARNCLRRGSNQGNTQNVKSLYHQCPLDFRCYLEVTLFEPRPFYLDTQESRGLVPPSHPACVGAVRAAAMTDADAVLLIGRKLDYQLGWLARKFTRVGLVRCADVPWRAQSAGLGRSMTA